MIDEDEYTKTTVGFGYNLSEIDCTEYEFLNSTVSAFMVGYLRALESGYKAQAEIIQDDCVHYNDGHPMGVKDLFALRLVLPEDLRNHVRLYRVATRLVPEVITMPIGDIEMSDLEEKS